MWSWFHTGASKNSDPRRSCRLSDCSSGASIWVWSGDQSEEESFVLWGKRRWWLIWRASESAEKRCEWMQKVIVVLLAFPVCCNRERLSLSSDLLWLNWFLTNHQQVNGYRGEKYIERIGLGIDGHEEERREQQRNRDYGKLQGVIYSDQFLNPMLKLKEGEWFWQNLFIIAIKVKSILMSSLSSSF